MTNTKLLTDLIETSEAALRDIEAESWEPAEEHIDDILVIAERLCQPQLSRGANYAKTTFAEGLIESVISTLK
jgi:hypothetical protein